MLVKVISSTDNETLSSRHFGTVVFPLGTPSLPSRINSSDLDGDRFFICWHESIINEIKDYEVQVNDDSVVRVDKKFNADEYAREKGFKDNWEDTPNLWFKIVQDSLIRNRSYHINCLVQALTSEYKDAVKTSGPDHPRAIIAGRAWKEANELEKHGEI